MSYGDSIKRWIGGAGQYPLYQLRLRGNCAIFTFHRVLSESEYRDTTFQQSIAVTDTAFRNIIQYIKKKYQIISLQELMDYSCGSRDWSTGIAYACITFDDGWLDNYTRAYPVIKELQVPATIFLSTDFIGSSAGFWWQALGDALSCSQLTTHQRKELKKLIDPLMASTQDTITKNSWNVDLIIETVKQYHCEKAPLITEKALGITDKKIVAHGLSWSHCEEMSAHDISFGSHTLSHPRLTLLEQGALEYELRVSKSRINEQKLNYVNAICYPYGDINSEVLSASQQHYDLGLTTRLGISTVDLNFPMNIPRINISNPIASNSNRLNYRLIQTSLKSWF